MNQFCKAEVSARGTFDIFLDGTYKFNLALRHPQVTLIPTERGNLLEENRAAGYRDVALSLTG